MSSKYLMKKFLVFSLLLCVLPAEAQFNGKFHQVFKTNGIIWGFDFIDNDKIVYSVKEKGYFLFDGKANQHHLLASVKDVYIAGQGGYLDIKVHPDFSQNNKIIFSYSKKAGKGATTAVSVGELKDNKLINIKEIFVADADTDEDIHFGGRMLFKNKNNFYLSIGDRNERKDAQNLKRHNGKIMNINMDGTFSVWSYGHRNPQGLSYYENELWSAEFGPRGGDELNKIIKNGNYGWPEVTHGREYWGPKIGVTSKEGMIDPVIYWVPSISPSGLHCYEGGEKLLKGKCFLANLSGEHIRVVDPKNIDSQQILLKELNLRFRQIAQAPDKRIYASTDEGVFGYLEITPNK